MSITLIDEALLPGSATPEPVGPTAILHMVGDLHMGAWLEARQDTAATDFLALNPTITQRVFMGDLTHDGQPANKAAAKAWMDSAGSGWLAVPGNHDYDQSQDADDFASDYGITVPWTHDVPDSNIRLIGVGPTSNSTSVTIPANDLAYLDAALDTTRDCLIFCHAPLTNSVAQATGQMDAEPKDDIAALLEAHPTVRAWFSGHTHSSLTSTNLVMTYSTGTQTLLAVNCSSLARIGHASDSTSMTLASPVVRCYADRLEVTFRDHKTGGTIPIGGQTVYTYAFA